MAGISRVLMWVHNVYVTHSTTSLDASRRIFKQKKRVLAQFSRQKNNVLKKKKKHLFWLFFVNAKISKRPGVAGNMFWRSKLFLCARITHKKLCLKFWNNLIRLKTFPRKSSPPPKMAILGGG